MNTFKEIALKYEKDVLSGKIKACKWTKLAIERNIADKTKEGIYFDEEEAERYLRFVHALRFTKGKYASGYFKMQPFQVWRYWVLMGWKRSDGTRRFRKAYIEEARKNGKSEEAAAFGLYGLIADNEYGAEIYTAATKRDQAKIVFDAAKAMVNRLRTDSKKAKASIGVHHSNIHVIGKNSKMEPISSESGKQDGMNPHYSIIDEYHAHKTSDLLEVLETGMGARVQPLTFIITTAGFNKMGPCYAYRRVCQDILLGIKQDESIFAVIYTLDDDDDWRDTSNWIKANPNLKGIDTLENYLNGEFRKAKNEGLSKEVQFKTKNLCMWTDSSSAWLNDETWMACVGEIPELDGKEAYAGLDLAATSDINAFYLLFPIDGKYYMKKYLWLPEGSAQREDVPYLQWANEGHIKLTPGDVMNHSIIAEDILELFVKYDIKRMAYDKYMAHHGTIQRLMEELPGDKLIEFRQGYISMSEPTKHLERVVKGKTLVHDGDPVTRWMCSNVEISIDPAGNIKIDKGKSQNKVDGMVALVMALAEATRPVENTTSVYETRGIIEI